MELRSAVWICDPNLKTVNRGFSLFPAGHSIRIQIEQEFEQQQGWKKNFSADFTFSQLWRHLVHWFATVVTRGSEFTTYAVSFPNHFGSGLRIFRSLTLGRQLIISS